MNRAILRISLATVGLFVTAQASAVDHEEELQYLADMEMLDADWHWSTGTYFVNGTAYPSSVVADSLFRNETDEVSFDLGRDWQTFRATIGLRDDASEGQAVHFELFRDNVSILSQTMSFGQSMPIEVDVTNALRLRLRVSDADQLGGEDQHPVWGSARLVRPKAHEHERSVSLDITKRRAKGKVTVIDGFATCAHSVPVEIEHYDGFGWETIATVLTDPSGSFKSRVPRTGAVKATATRLELGEPWPSDVCDKDKSRRRSLGN